MPRLCLIIPTHNRAACVAWYLRTQAEAFHRLQIDLIIFDSSEEDDTRQIVEEYARQYAHIIYQRYDGIQESCAIDQKVYTAAQMFAGRYDFLWFSSDGTVIQIERIYTALCAFMECGADLFIWNNGSIQTKEYDDSLQLFLDLTWRMTTLSSIVTSTSFLCKAMEYFPISHPQQKGFWLPVVYFFQMAQAGVRAIYHTEEALWVVNQTRGDAFWASTENVLWQWGKIWCEVIDALPAYYNAYKAEVILSHDAHMHLFALRRLFTMKINGNLTWQKVCRYHQYIPRITATWQGWFFLLAGLPCKGLLTVCKKIYLAFKL